MACLLKDYSSWVFQPLLSSFGESAVLIVCKTTADTVTEIAEMSNETVPWVEEVSPAGTWTLSEMENVDTCVCLALAEELIMRYEKADNNTGCGTTKITLTMHLTSTVSHCCLEM